MEPIYSPIIPRKKTIIDSPNDKIINSGANPNSKLSQNNNFNIKNEKFPMIDSHFESEEDTI